jgi:glycosyltransferase involved in cell wall biosynthesis
MAVTSSHEITKPPTEDDRPTITEPYVLFVCVPIEIDEQGRRWTIAAWAKDLALHLNYLDNLTLVSPATRRISADLVSLDGPPFNRLKFIDLPWATSKWQALKTLPRHVLQYWRAVGPARIVHAGFGGWPIIQAWLAVPLAKLRRKFILANVESSFWRASVPGLPWHKRLQGRLGEYMTRYCLRISDIRLFTSKTYLQELLPPQSPRAYVTPATWLNEEWILGEGKALEFWAAKQGRVRMLFAGRLIPDKGVSVLLSAIRAAVEAGTDVEFSIHPIGSSPMRNEYIAAAQSLATRGYSVTVLDEVPFGDPFLSLLRGFDAILVPSLSDEQPRIAYEAFSQAVPVIGSTTGGIREVVESGVNGRLSPPNDASALAESIIWAGQNRAELRAMGLRGLASVRGLTHQAMHQKRHVILRELLDKR